MSGDLDRCRRYFGWRPGTPGTFRASRAATALLPGSVWIVWEVFGDVCRALWDVSIKVRWTSNLINKNGQKVQNMSLDNKFDFQPILNRTRSALINLWGTSCVPCNHHPPKWHVRWPYQGIWARSNSVDRNYSVIPIGSVDLTNPVSRSYQSGQ